MSEAVHALLERNARKYPLDVAVRWPEGDVTLTWSDLNGRANTMAHYLMENKTGRGSKVAIFVSNRPEFILSYFAALKTGAAVVPVNTRLTPGEISHILTDSGASTLVFDDVLRGAAEEVLSRIPGLKVALSTGDVAGLHEKYATVDPGVDVQDRDLAEVLYTSGTTGKPKGVLLTHRAVYLAGSMMAYEAGIHCGDRCLHLMPLSHSAPLNLFLVGATYAGAANVLGTFTPQALLELCAGEKTTHFFGAPVAYLLACRVPNVQSYDLTSAKVWVYGGAPMPREALQKVMTVFPGKFMGVYGLTEAGPNGMALYPQEHPDFAGSIGRRGTAIAEVRVVNGAGEDAAPGEVGEIVIKTPSIMLGYHQLPEATGEALAGGWLHTGDLAVRDEAGYVWIKDRKKDMIITGGVNVYPKEVEDILLLCPGVADAAVVGLPNPDWGETVMALVVPSDPENPVSEEAVRAFCRERLADYKVPRVVEIAAAVPRNSTGKVQKHVIKASYSQQP